MLSLCLGNLLMIEKSATNMDIFKGTIKRNSKEWYSNPFHLNALTNFKHLFQGDKLLFWWPSALKTYCDGTSYPMAPRIRSWHVKHISPEIMEKTPYGFNRYRDMTF